MTRARAWHGDAGRVFSRDLLRRTMTSLRVLPVAIALTALSGCASTRLALPRGPGTPLPDFAPIFETAVAQCRSIRTVEAMIRLRGRGGGANLNGRVRAGLAAPASLRLEGLAPFGAPGFYFVARAGEALLWLTREGRVLTDVPPAAVLETLTGVSLDPSDLRAVLTGCLTSDPEAIGGRRYGDWVVVDLRGGAVAYLRPNEGEHRLVAGTRDGLTIEYDDFRRRLPWRVRVISAAVDPLIDGRPLTDLTASLSQVNLNVELVDAAFSIDVPPDVVPMTLRDLRQAGPLEATGEAQSSIEPR